jgi:aldose 1-epimerase
VEEKRMPRSIQREVFGKTEDEQEVHLYTLENERGLLARVMSYGAILTHLYLPDRRGAMGDVVLGFDDLDGYLKGHPYFGATVGRVANRIAGGRFSLNGKEYTLARNDGQNHLHGGLKGLDKVVFRAVPIQDERGPSLELSYRSPDGEEGYPGNLLLTVVYTLTDASELIVEMTATTDAPTPVNLAHHSYWNLAGHDAGAVLDHELKLMAHRYTKVNGALIPTGEIAEVMGTPYDFLRPKRIGAEICGGAPGASAAGVDGYDINFVLDGPRGELRPAAIVTEPGSGRVMELLTTEPGVQLYTGNSLDGSLRGKGGVAYQKYQGFCLETQGFPDAVNQPTFPSVILAPGEMYRHVMVHRFSVR